MSKLDDQEIREQTHAPVVLSGHRRLAEASRERAFKDAAEWEAAPCINLTHKGHGDSRRFCSLCMDTFYHTLKQGRMP